MNYFFEAVPLELKALAAGLFTYAMTALGAAAVFAFKSFDKKVLDAMLGFAGGVMIAASYFSLISPAEITARSLGMTTWVVLSLGFLSGAAALYIGDRIFAAAEKRLNKGAESISRRSLLLLFSITLHNIPEGLAVGVAFGSLAHGIEGATLGAAIMLALGIGVQNLPEGMAISLPLLRDGFTKRRAFFYGHISGAVEPVAAFFGALLASTVRTLLPFLLTFAAGAMITVVCEEIIPESQSGKSKGLAAAFTIVGFTVMMMLDTAF